MRIIFQQVVGDSIIGVIETPCFPNSFYAGWIRFGEPAYNGSGYHPTKEGAMTAANEMIERFSCTR